MALIDQFGIGWYNQLMPCFGQPWWKALHQNVKKRYAQICPVPDQMFRAFRETPFEDLKVVIIGQDPYPSEHADGLAFSTSKDHLPKSLQMIYKELEREYGSKPSSGDLSTWAQQGVLLLNTSLSVDLGRPGSHSNFGWQYLIHAVLKAAVGKDDMIIVAWGSPAQRVTQPYEQTAHVLKASHPMAEIYSNGGLKFIGNGHFSKINQLLTQNNKQPIQWIF